MRYRGESTFKNLVNEVFRESKKYKILFERYYEGRTTLESISDYLVGTPVRLVMNYYHHWVMRGDPDSEIYDGRYLMEGVGEVVMVGPLEKNGAPWLGGEAGWLVCSPGEKDARCDVARRIGIRVHWIMNHNGLPYFPLSPSMMKRAIATGARKIGKAAINDLVRLRQVSDRRYYVNAE